MDHHSDQMWVIVETHDQQFAVSANDVREIVVLPDVTAVPNCRPQDRGVINLRGRILPVFDMRKQFGWQSIPDELRDFCKLMGQREEDHRNWLTALEKSVTEKTEFKLATDPTKCAFGQWYCSYKPQSPWIAGLLRKFEAPHAKIHALASAAQASVRRGDDAEAMRLIDGERESTLQEMVSLFQQLKQLMMDTMKEIVLIISNPQGAFGFSVDRALAVERISPEMIKEVPIDPSSRESGSLRRALQRSATGPPTMILEPALFLAPTHADPKGA